MVPWEVGKVEYSEEEAASALGITVEQLRCLVREHVINDESDLETPIPSFRPADLLLLKMLVQREVSPVSH